MFKKIEVMDKQKHKDLKFTQAGDFSFAKEVAVVPLSLTEMNKACQFYPIIIPVKGPLIPQALLSMKQGQNVYVNDDGKWTVPYIPTHIRRYPFVLAQPDKTAESSSEEGVKYAVCLDRDADHFKKDQGEDLFDENGNPSEFTTKAMDFLKNFQAEMVATEKMFTQLQENGVLVERQLNVNVGGETKSAGSFLVADPSRLKDVDDQTLVDWVRNGLLSLIYAQNFSLSNIYRLAGQIEVEKSK